MHPQQSIMTVAMTARSKKRTVTQPLSVMEQGCCPPAPDVLPEEFPEEPPEELPEELPEEGLPPIPSMGQASSVQPDDPDEADEPDAPDEPDELPDCLLLSRSEMNSFCIV